LLDLTVLAVSTLIKGKSAAELRWEIFTSLEMAPQRRAEATT
jgi:hypothetical protein